MTEGRMFTFQDGVLEFLYNIVFFHFQISTLTTDKSKLCSWGEHRGDVMYVSDHSLFC